MTIYNALAGSSFTGIRAKIPTVSKRRSLMLIGDSITWGFGVSQNNTYAKLLQGFIDLNATNVDGVPNTDEWVARSVHIDDIAIQRDSQAVKLTANGSPTYQLTGSFVGGPPPAEGISEFIRNLFSAPVGTAIMLDADNDGLIVTPSAPTRFLIAMVEVTNTGTGGMDLTAINQAQATVGTINVRSDQSDASLGTGSPLGVHRLIYDCGAGNTASAFLLRRLAGAPVGANCRVLAVNPTNLYGASNYLHVQVHARGSYRPSDYMNAVAEISKTIILPTNDTTAPTDPVVFVLALGTVSIYFNESSTLNKGDRRQSPASLADDLRTLVTNLRAAHPLSPIIMTYPPIPAGTWFPLSGFTRADYDAAIQSTAIRLGCPLIDLRGALNPASDYIIGDGIHPNNNGHINLANAYKAALRV